MQVKQLRTFRNPELCPPPILTNESPREQRPAIAPMPLQHPTQGQRSAARPSVPGRVPWPSRDSAVFFSFLWTVAPSSGLGVGSVSVRDCCFSRRHLGVHGKGRTLSGLLVEEAPGGVRAGWGVPALTRGGPLTGHPVTVDAELTEVQAPPHGCTGENARDQKEVAASVTSSKSSSHFFLLI